MLRQAGIVMLGIWLLAGCDPNATPDTKDLRDAQAADASDPQTDPNAAVDIEATVNGSATSGRFDPTSTQAQAITADQSTAITGASATLPAGALAIDTNITLDEGVDLSSDGLLTDLGLDGVSDEALVPVDVSADGAAVLTAPMTLAIPLPTQALLQTATYMIIYRINKGDGSFAEGVWPPEQIALGDGQLSIDTLYFGTYQAVRLRPNTPPPAAVENVTTKQPQPKSTIPYSELTLAVPVTAEIDEEFVIAVTGSGRETADVSLLANYVISPAGLNCRTGDTAVTCAAGQTGNYTIEVNYLGLRTSGTVQIVPSLLITEAELDSFAAGNDPDVTLLLTHAAGIDQLAVFGDENCTTAYDDATVTLGDPSTVEVTLGADGRSDFYVQTGYSAANLSSTCQTTGLYYVLDQTAPVTPSIVPATAVFNTSLTVTINHTPAPDFASLRYTLNGTPPGDCSAGTSALPGANVAIPSGANRTLLVVACDLVGNLSPVATGSYTYDNTDPVLTLAAFVALRSSNVDDYTIAGTCTEIGEPVDLTIEDNDGSTPDVSATPNCEVGGAWSAANLDLSGLVDSSLTVTASQTDGVGNFGDVTDTLIKATQFTDITANGHSACAINASGELYCWGANPDSQLGTADTVARDEVTRIGGDTDWQSVSMGVKHACAIKTGGTLWCWGDNTDGQFGDGTTTSQTIPTQIGIATDWMDVAAGEQFSCAIKTDNSMHCSGHGGDGRLANGSTTPSIGFALVSGGGWADVDTTISTACAVKTDNTLFCWGKNTSGQVGVGNSTPQYSPIQVANTAWSKVAVGRDHVCGIDDGDLYCWGNRGFGRVGDGITSGNVTSPALIDSTETWVDLGLGEGHSCGIRGTSNSLLCWGDNTFGQAARDDLLLTNVPTLSAGSSSFMQVRANRYSTCVITNTGRLRCAGSNEFGELAIGETGRKTAPADVGDALGPLAAGNQITCFIDPGDSDRLSCTGLNNKGQLGANDFADRPEFTSIATNVSSIALSYSASCSVLVDDSLACTGENLDYQFGNNSTAGANLFTPVGATSWLQVALGFQHGCGIDDVEDLYCWGTNSFAQVGDAAENASYPLPVNIPPFSDWGKVDVNMFHSCGLRTSGQLYCWGRNNYSQLGLGAPGVNVNAPSQVTGAWIDVAVGLDHSCGIQSDNTLWCWGRNDFGQIGDGSIIQRNSPVQESTGATNWQMVTTLSTHTCAINSSDELYCWGSNNYGQLAIADLAQRNTPQQVPGNYDDVAIGSDHSCASGTDGKLYCWGSNYRGQLGDGSGFIGSLTPVEFDSGA